MSARSPTPASRATSAASPAVEWSGLARPGALVGEKRRLVDEHVRTRRRLHHRRRGRRVPRQHDAAPTPGRADDLLGGDDPAVVDRHGLAALQGAARGPVRHPERFRGRDVEAARTLVLAKRVAQRPDPVSHGERLHPVSVALDSVPGPQLDDDEWVGDPPDDDTERAEERARAPWAVNADRRVPAAQPEGLQHPRQPEDVIGVQVGEEDVLEVDEPDVRAKELPLGSLAAVDEQPIASATQDRRGGAARGRGCGGSCPEEDEIEVHGRRS